MKSKAAADHNWDRMAKALIDTLAAWRQIIAKPFMGPRALQRMAEQQSAKISWALKTSAMRRTGT
jgi:hypothetical protein